MTLPFMCQIDYSFPIADETYAQFGISPGDPTDYQNPYPLSIAPSSTGAGLSPASFNGLAPLGSSYPSPLIITPSTGQSPEYPSLDDYGSAPESYDSPPLESTSSWLEGFVSTRSPSIEGPSANKYHTIPIDILSGQPNTAAESIVYNKSGEGLSNQSCSGSPTTGRPSEYHSYEELNELAESQLTYVPISPFDQQTWEIISNNPSLENDNVIPQQQFMDRSHAYPLLHYHEVHSDRSSPDVLERSLYHFLVDDECSTRTLSHKGLQSPSPSPAQWDPQIYINVDTEEEVVEESEDDLGDAQCNPIYIRNPNPQVAQEHQLQISIAPQGSSIHDNTFMWMFNDNTRISGLDYDVTQTGSGLPIPQILPIPKTVTPSKPPRSASQYQPASNNIASEATWLTRLPGKDVHGTGIGEQPGLRDVASANINPAGEFQRGTPNFTHRNTLKGGAESSPSSPTRPQVKRLRKSSTDKVVSATGRNIKDLPTRQRQETTSNSIGRSSANTISPAPIEMEFGAGNITFQGGKFNHALKCPDVNQNSASILQPTQGLGTMPSFELGELAVQNAGINNNFNHYGHAHQHMHNGFNPANAHMDTSQPPMVQYRQSPAFLGPQLPPTSASSAAWEASLSALFSGSCQRPAEEHGDIFSELFLQCNGNKGSDGSGEDGQKRKRKPFSEVRRKGVRDVRQKGACVRCQFLRESCDLKDPCGNCIRVQGKQKIWKLPCARMRITDADLFRKGNSKFKLEAATELPSLEWKSGSRRIQLKLGRPPPFSDKYWGRNCGLPSFTIEVNEFVPKGQLLYETWRRTDGTEARAEIPPVAACDVENLEAAFKVYINNSFTWYKNDMVSEEKDPLVKLVFVEAIRFVEQHDGERTAMVRDALKIWIICRCISEGIGIIGDETYGIREVQDPDSPYYRTVPISPILDYQIDTLGIKQMKELKDRLLKKLKARIQQRRHTQWKLDLRSRSLLKAGWINGKERQRC
ncbi:hypothetical protein DFH27DRAFT_378386 [Peziza echinospora]|nr:hypothetical protein DFH27DRAFT_378386 [Peziza echinospora]